MEKIFPRPPPPPGKFQLSFVYFFECFGLREPLPHTPGNSIPFCRDHCYFKVVFSSLEGEIVWID